jgi:hypothetical protein
MSTQHNVTIIFGFPAHRDYPIQRQNPINQHGCDLYLDEFLEKHDFRPIEQFNHGQSNGGRPDFFAGIKLFETEDMLRSEATPLYEHPGGDTFDIESVELFATFKDTIRPAHIQLVTEARDLLCPKAPIGIYMLLDAA